MLSHTHHPRHEVVMSSYRSRRHHEFPEPFVRKGVQCGSPTLLKDHTLSLRITFPFEGSHPLILSLRVTFPFEGSHPQFYLFLINAYDAKNYAKSMISTEIWQHNGQIGASPKFTKQRISIIEHHYASCNIIFIILIIIIHYHTCT